MRETWTRIESWLSENAPAIREQLLDGATEEDIRWAESQLGCELPPHYKLSHSLHNGAKGCGLLEYWDFYSLAEAVEAWKQLKECYDRGIFSEFHSEPQGPIRADWWNPKWIPLTGEPGGNCLCLDLDPDEGGQIGQVISWQHDDSARPLIASSYAEWWVRFANDLEAGLFILDVEGVLVRKGGPEDRTSA